MGRPEKLQVKRSWLVREWAAIGISVVALGLSGVEFYENHERTIAWDTPRVKVEQDLDPDDPLIGVKIVNLGTAPAAIKGLTFYIDRKPGDVDDVIDEGKLTDVGTYEFDGDDTLAVGESEWLLSKSTKDKKDVDRFVEFIDKHVAVQTNVCSITTGKCEIRCSAEEWCK
jgi:hypothetical protein